MYECNMWSIMGGAAQAGEEGDIDPAFLSSRKSQKYGADLTAAAAANVRSGDADLPTKAPLHERRAKFDQVLQALFACKIGQLQLCCRIEPSTFDHLSILWALPTAACSAMLRIEYNSLVVGIRSVTRIHANRQDGYLIDSSTRKHQQECYLMTGNCLRCKPSGLPRALTKLQRRLAAMGRGREPGWTLAEGMTLRRTRIPSTSRLQRQRSARRAPARISELIAEAPSTGRFLLLLLPRPLSWATMTYSDDFSRATQQPSGSHLGTCNRGRILSLHRDPLMDM